MHYHGVDNQLELCFALVVQWLVQQHISAVGQVYPEEAGVRL